MLGWVGLDAFINPKLCLKNSSNPSKTNPRCRVGGLDAPLAVSLVLIVKM